MNFHSRILRVRLALLFTAILAWPGAAFAQQPAAEEADSPARAASVTSTRGVVAADNVEASRVGARILAAGGNAADAAAATLLANGVLNPFASGLGGGGFCLYRPVESGEVHVIDFRERAPINATADMYVVDGKAVRRLQIRGGLAVGVPGEPAGLWALQQRFGDLPWRDVVQPAVELAKGYEAGPLLEKRLRGRSEEDLKKHEKLAALFQIDGRWARAGEPLERPALARTLELYRDKGPIIFYHGDVGRTIIEAVNEAGGIFQPADLSTYSVANREPIVGTYRNYSIAGMPPPSSGGAVLIETLNILENFDLEKKPLDAQAIHLIAEALKHGFADRARWMGDTDFVEVPVERLTSKEYARKLAAKIKAHGVLPLEEYGSLDERPEAQIPDDSGTTHVSIIDAAGNMAACTSTINTSFGSMVYDEKSGIILNNEMADFTAQPGTPNNYGLVGTAQNAVAPKKRPLSSMSPTLVLRGGEPFMAVGGSGGPTIITGTLLTMLNMMDFGMSPAEAVAAPRIHAQWRPDKIYAEPEIPGKELLKKWGHTLRLGPAFNSVQLVVRNPDGTLTGVSDPRKMGAPAAEPAQSGSKGRQRSKSHDANLAK
jgi:gamma-glutamyltranspeptidase/glutathione hydrolase